MSGSDAGSLFATTAFSVLVYASGGASTDIVTAAESLARQAQSLRTPVAGFIAQVRAALKRRPPEASRAKRQPGGVPLAASASPAR